VLDRLPGGRPPAWDAGEAIPWPSPGEKAAAELAGPDGELDYDPESPGLREGEAEADEPGDGGAERRKRKQRD
jgi:hypothetical protein